MLGRGSTMSVASLQASRPTLNVWGITEPAVCRARRSARGSAKHRGRPHASQFRRSRLYAYPQPGGVSSEHLLAASLITSCSPSSDQSRNEGKHALAGGAAGTLRRLSKSHRPEENRPRERLTIVLKARRASTHIMTWEGSRSAWASCQRTQV